jgi:putative ABC transport system ATP-binding protein
MSRVLRLDGVERRHGGAAGGFRVVVERLEVAAGECVALTGPSGSGKSTLLDLLGLIAAPSAAGRFTLNLPGVAGAGAGADVAALWARGDGDGLAELRGRGIGYVLQTGGLLPFLTVAGNIGLSCRLNGMAATGRVDALAQALDIERHLAKKPQALSIGERQRVAIARALAHGPALVLADEPTASLDPANAARVMTLLVGLARRLGVAMVVASHDHDLLSGHDVRRLSPALADDGAGGTIARFTG